MNGERVGAWSWPAAGQELQYADSWLASPRGRPLSLSLPFQPGNSPVAGPLVQRYFDNLLPDSRAIRERLASRFRAGSTASFDLLAEIGRDCVGALQVVPEGEEPGEIREIRGVELDDAEVAAELAAALGSTPSASTAGPEKACASRWRAPRRKPPCSATKADGGGRSAPRRPPIS